VVRWPHEVLAEFGTRLPDDVEIRMWDSSSRRALHGAAATPGGHRAHAQYLAAASKQIPIAITTPPVTGHERAADQSHALAEKDAADDDHQKTEAPAMLRSLSTTSVAI
jgi:hypothetical protein